MTQHKARWSLRRLCSGGVDALCPELTWPHYSSNPQGIAWIDGFVLDIVDNSPKAKFLDSIGFADALQEGLAMVIAAGAPTESLVLDWQHSLSHAGTRRPICLPIPDEAHNQGATQTDPELEVNSRQRFLRDLNEICPPRLFRNNRRASRNDKEFPATCSERLKLLVEACLNSVDHIKCRAPRTRYLSFRVRPDLLFSASGDLVVGLIYPPCYGETGDAVPFFTRKCSLADLQAGAAALSDMTASLGGTLKRAMSQFNQWYQSNPLSSEVVSVVVIHNEIRIYDSWPGDLDAASEIRRAAAGVRSEISNLGGSVLAALDNRVIERMTVRRLKSASNLRLLAGGVSGAPGALSGLPCIDIADVENAHRRGIPAVLFGEEPGPHLLPAVMAADGLAFRRGGPTSHVAVIARGARKPAVLGVEQLGVDFDRRSISVGRHELTQSSWITIDGSAAKVYSGRSEIVEAGSTGLEDLSVVLAWCDANANIRVYGNADTGDEVRAALAAGATGIGLCRLEHLLSRPDHLRPLQTALVLSWLLRGCSQRVWTATLQLRAWPDAGATKARARLEETSAAEHFKGAQLDASLSAIRDAVASELREIYLAAGGRQVVVRLIDPPISEFLDLPIAHAIASEHGEDAKTDVGRLVQSHNSMLGLRGIRLGLLFPEITRAQVLGICEAALGTAHTLKLRPKAAILLPMVIDGEEVAEMRRIIKKVVPEVDPKGELEISIGSMIETPRAALLARSIAQRSDFLSIGTNDLTQFVWASSRDSADSEFLETLPYARMLAPPFHGLDREGVGALVKTVIGDARLARSDIEVGVCGEQVGDLASLRFLLDAGATYVSCAAARVQVVRLLAAQASMLKGTCDGNSVPWDGGAG